jgi:hypothetical protein
MTPEFKPFPKMPRLSRECVISEKIDGTNATIQIIGNHNGYYDADPMVVAKGETFSAIHDAMIPAVMYAGSRTRWITLANDNFGFAKWAYDHTAELFNLGLGHHFGEWWGSGIQRGYGLSKGEKRFSLFNAIRWVAGDDPIGVASTTWNDKTRQMEQKLQQRAPACCGVVPVLYRGPFCTNMVKKILHELEYSGSSAAPGYDKPEGIVCFHIAGCFGFKKTIEKDEEPKGKTTK